MLEEMKKLEILSIWEGTSPRQMIYPARFCHCFVFKVSGKSKYELGDSSVTLDQGKVLYIPQGCNYRTVLLTESSNYIAINFYAEMRDTPCSLVDFHPPFDAKSWFHSMLRFWILGGAANHYQCYAMFYKMLSEHASNRSYQTSRQKNLIKDSIDYLEKHLFDPYISIRDMIACSGISTSYFSQLFLSVYGQSPKQYIKNTRLAQAYTILASGEYYDIQSVAELVGYHDSLYFSKIFKQKYGIAPSELKHGCKP